MLTFPVLGVDILCELRNLLDACPRSTWSFPFMGLMSFVSSVPVGHMSGWPVGYMVFFANSLRMCELLASSICDPILRGVFADPLLQVVSMSSSCELYLRTRCIQVGPIWVMGQRSRLFLGLELTITDV